MRLLNGDGIFLADPTRIVLLDQENRLLARSRESVGISLVCDSDRESCWGYAHDKGRLLALDPSSFRHGGQVVPGPLQRDGLGEIQHGNESWGFTEREASIAEYIEAEWVLAQECPMTIALFVVFGIIGATVTIVGFHAPNRRDWGRLFWFCVFLLLRLAALAVVAMLVLYFMALTGLSSTTSLAGLVIGASGVSFWELMRRRRNHAPSAATT
jgi:hypothetical protein